MKIEIVNVADLKLDPNNARKHSLRNLDAIKNSLKEFGQRRTIAVTKNNVVVAGNGTLEAAKSLGWKEITVARIPDAWTDTQIKAYALADNRSSELATWDEDILISQLLELDITGWDITQLEFDALKLDSKITDADVSPQLGETKYAIILDCDNEYHQTETLETLAAQGLRVRPLML